MANNKPPEPHLYDLAKFLKSFLSDKQISDFISLLIEQSSKALDPEESTVTAKPAQKVEVPATIEDVFKEMEEAYSITKFPPPSPEESRRVRDLYPDLIGRLNAFQGRHLVEMLRKRLGG